MILMDQSAQYSDNDVDSKNLCEPNFIPLTKNDVYQLEF